MFLQYEKGTCARVTRKETSEDHTEAFCPRSPASFFRGTCGMRRTAQNYDLSQWLNRNQTWATLKGQIILPITYQFALEEFDYMNTRQGSLNFFSIFFFNIYLLHLCIKLRSTLNLFPFNLKYISKRHGLLKVKSP